MCTINKIENRSAMYGWFFSSPILDLELTIGNLAKALKEDVVDPLLTKMTNHVWYLLACIVYNNCLIGVHLYSSVCCSLIYTNVLYFIDL